MSKNKARWSDQHLNQLRSQIEAFKQIVKYNGMPNKNNEGPKNLTSMQLAVQRAQTHQHAMESYREKFEDYDLDYSKLAGRLRLHI